MAIHQEELRLSRLSRSLVWKNEADQAEKDLATVIDDIKVILSPRFPSLGIIFENFGKIDLCLTRNIPYEYFITWGNKTADIEPKKYTLP